MPFRLFPPGTPLELSQEPEMPLFSYVQQGSTPMSAPGLMIGPTYIAFWKDWIDQSFTVDVESSLVEEPVPTHIETPVTPERSWIVELDALQARLTAVEATIARLLDTRWTRFLMWGRKVWRAIVSNCIPGR